MLNVVYFISKVRVILQPSVLLSYIYCLHFSKLTCSNRVTTGGHFFERKEKQDHTVWGSYFVNEIQSHGSLSDPHFLRLPVLSVCSSDFVHTFMQSSCRLVFLPIFLSLSVQKNWTINIRYQICIGTYSASTQRYISILTFNLEAAFSITYLVLP